MRILTPVVYVLIGIGVLYIAFGLIVQRYPLPVTVIALVIFVAVTVIFMVLNPENVLQGLLFKIIIIVALVQAIKTAITYERERNQAREELAYEEE